MFRVREIDGEVSESLVSWFVLGLFVCVLVYLLFDVLIIHIHVLI